MSNLLQKFIQAKALERGLLTKSSFDTVKCCLLFYFFYSKRFLFKEMLKIKLNLSDLNAALRSMIASSTAARHSTAARLQATTQSTLDNLHNSLTSLRSDLPGPKEALWPPANSQLQRIDGELGVRWGEFRTRAEGVKLRAIYAFTMGIATVFLAILVERSRHPKKPSKINEF